jgi:hypothetical protein
MRRRRERRSGDEFSWGDEPLVDAVRDGFGGSRALRRLYWVLGFTIVVAIAGVLAFPDADLVDRFGANVATEAAAILVTLVFVHRFLQQQDRDRRLRASIGALRRASRSLDRLAGVWMLLLKGTLPKPEMERPRALPALFRPSITEGVVDLDLAALRDAEGGSSETWVTWASRELNAAVALLHDIVVAYGASLDPAYVEAVDDLIDDPFLRTFAELAAGEVDGRTWRMRMNAARAQRETHFARLVRLLELHNALARQAGKVRATWSAPRSGVLGLNLPPDHDLKVNVRLEPELWQAGPPAGSLRAQQKRAGA